MNAIDTLNARFGIADHLQFLATQPGLPVAEINTAQGTALVALHGGHVLAWQPTGQQPVIWLSPAAVFESGKAVRGGVPICWPWFGPMKDKPLHGFARTCMWAVRGTSLDETGQVILRMGICDDASTRVLWEHGFDLELIVTVGQTLTIALNTRNTGATPFTLNEALHTYFCVGDVTKTVVQGLDGCDYLDKTQNMTKKSQSGAVAITEETDRVYLNTASDCLIEDAAWGRTIRVAKQGSQSTVVWNPWAEREKSIADMVSGGYLGMLCVETTNAGPDQVTLAPGEMHTLVACISID